MILRQISLDKDYTNEELKRFLYQMITELNIHLQSIEKAEDKTNG